jgi:hypothetical protein
MTTVAATGMNDVQIESERNDNTWGAWNWWEITEVNVGDVVDIEIHSDNLTTNDNYSLSYSLCDQDLSYQLQTGNWTWSAVNNASTEYFNFTVPDVCSLEMSAELYVQYNGTNRSWESSSYFEWDVVDCTDPSTSLTGQYDDGTWGPMISFNSNITAAVGDTRMLYVNSSDLTQGESYAIHFAAYDCNWNNFWQSSSSIVSFSAAGATDSRYVNVTMPDTCEVNFMSNLYLMNYNTNSSTWLGGSDFGWQITNYTNPVPEAYSNTTSGMIGDVVTATIDSVNLTAGVDYELEIYVYDGDWNTIYSNSFAWTAMANSSSEMINITLPDSCWIDLDADLYEDTATNGSNGSSLSYLNSDYLSWSITDCSDPELEISGYHDNGTWSPLADWWQGTNNVSANVGDTRMLEITSSGLRVGSDFELFIDVYDDDYNTLNTYNWSWYSASNSSTEFINVTMPNTCYVMVEAELYQSASTNNTAHRDSRSWEWEINDCEETGVVVTGELNNGSWGEYEYWDTPEAYIGDTIMLEFESDGLTYGDDYSLSFIAYNNDGYGFDSALWNWTAYSNSSIEFINITMPDTCYVQVEVDLYTVDISNNSTNHYWEDDSEWSWDILDCTAPASASVTMFGEIYDGSWADLSNGARSASIGDVIDVEIESNDLELDGVNYSLQLQLYQDSDLADQIYYNWTAYSSNSTEWYNFTVMDYCGYSINVALYSDDGDGWLSYENGDNSYWNVNDCTRPGVVIEGEHANGSWGPMEWNQDTRIDSWVVGDQVTYSVYAYDLDSTENYTMEIEVNDMLGSNLFTANHNFSADSMGQAGPYNISLIAPDTCNIGVMVNLYEIKDGWNNRVNGVNWNNDVDDCTSPDISLMGATGQNSLDHLDWKEHAMIGEVWTFEMSVSDLLPGSYTHKITVQDMWGDIVGESILNETRDATQLDDVTTFQTTYTFGSDCHYDVRATVYVQVQSEWGDELRHYQDQSASFDINDCSMPDMTISAEHTNGTWGPQERGDNVTAIVGENISAGVNLDSLEIGSNYRLDISWWNGTLWEGSSSQGYALQWNATSLNASFSVDNIVQDSCRMELSVSLSQVRDNVWGGEQRAQLDHQKFNWDITDTSENCPPVDEPWGVNFGLEFNLQQNVDNISGQVSLNYTLTDWFRLMFDANEDGSLDQTELDSFLADLEGDGDMDIPIEMFFDNEEMGEPDSMVVTYTILNGLGDWDDGMNWNLIMALDVVLNETDINKIEIEVFDPHEFGDDDRESIAMFSLDAMFSSYNPAMVITSVEMGGTSLNHTDSTVSTSFASEDLELITIIIEDPNAIDDADGDGVADLDDLCPNTDTTSTVDLVGCAANQLDADNDGIMDDADVCADTPTTDLDIDSSGCGESQRDSDGDGIMDAYDLCADTPSTAIDVNADGCSQDDDADGWSNQDEANCNTSGNDSTSMPNDFDGDGLCDFVDYDDDNDGWTDANETDCGTNGLNDNSTPLDSDGDGICDMVDLSPYPNANMLPSCSVAYSIGSTVSFMGTSVETRMDGGTTMSTPLSGSFDISLPVGTYMIFIECSDPDGDDMTVTITEGSNSAQTIPLGNSFYAEMNFTLTEAMVGSGEDIRLQWSDSAASGEIRMSVSVIALDQPIDITPEDVEEGGLPGFTGMLGVLSLLGAAIIQRRRT